ncbi:hypothetical protein [Leifsonia poae]|uniref:hypothetical protein n=1 Tax=Leifsonia poae TaxID=110933 RepID=UPI003D66C331
MPPTDTAPFRRPGAGEAPTVAHYALTDRDVRTDYAEAPEEPEDVDPLMVHFAELAEDDKQTDAALATISTADEPATLVVGSILDRVDVSPKRNPYFLALWILGGGFIVLGIVLYAVSVYTSYTSSSTELDLTTLVFSQIGWMLAAPLVSVGLATIVALVLLSALRARPAPTSAERD